MNNLNFQSKQYRQLIDKFKRREEQTSLQEALVYLKLRNYQCDNSKALIFAKKKEKCIDGTINKDGPAGYRKLRVLKPESKLINGWLRGEKHKYFGTTGYTDFLRKSESVEKKQITKYNQKSRQMQEEMRKMRSKPVVTIDLMKPRQSLQKIGTIKEDASKERQNRSIFVQYKGVRLDQTTKNFFREAENFNEEGLILKLDVFESLIGDKDLELKIDAENMKGKTLSSLQTEGIRKRDAILAYQQKLENYNDSKLKLARGQHKSWTKLVHKNQNEDKGLVFRKANVEQASNPLILMNSKQLKKDLLSNEEKCGENLTKYTSFYNNMQKAMKLQFLSKRRYSQTELRDKKKNLNKQEIQ